MVEVSASQHRKCGLESLHGDFSRMCVTNTGQFVFFSFLFFVWWGQIRQSSCYSILPIKPHHEMHMFRLITTSIFIMIILLLQNHYYHYHRCHHHRRRCRRCHLLRYHHKNNDKISIISVNNNNVINCDFDICSK